MCCWTDGVEPRSDVAGGGDRWPDDAPGLTPFCLPRPLPGARPLLPARPGGVAGAGPLREPRALPLKAPWETAVWCAPRVRGCNGVPLRRPTEPFVLTACAT